MRLQQSEQRQPLAILGTDLFPFSLFRVFYSKILISGAEESLSVIISDYRLQEIITLVVTGE